MSERTDRSRQCFPILTRLLALAHDDPGLRGCLGCYVCQQGPQPEGSPVQFELARWAVLLLWWCPEYRESFCRGLRRRSATPGQPLDLARREQELLAELEALLGRRDSDAPGTGEQVSGET